MANIQKIYIKKYKYYIININIKYKLYKINNKIKIY